MKQQILTAVNFHVNSGQTKFLLLIMTVSSRPVYFVIRSLWNTNTHMLDGYFDVAEQGALEFIYSEMMQRNWLKDKVRHSNSADSQWRGWKRLLHTKWTPKEVKFYFHKICIILMNKFNTFVGGDILTHGLLNLNWNKLP